MSSVLFVCLGNICRSPTAEAVFRRVAPEATVDSAGTGGWHIGDPPYGPAIAAAEARGYPMSDLRARQFMSADFDRFDLIIAMDRQNLADIEAQRPDGSDTPVRLMLDHLPEAGMRDVPDPYYTRDFEGALDLVEAACRVLARET